MRRIFFVFFVFFAGFVTACAAPVEAPVDADPVASPGGKADWFGEPSRLEDRTAGLPPILPGQPEIVAELPYPPGNVAASADGRLFFTFHPEGNRGDIQVAELVDGEPVAYPNEQFQRDAHSILSIRIDDQGRLWTLDYGNLGLSRPRLTAIDLATDAVVFEYRFPRSAAGFGSMLNDFQISPDGTTAYITDQSLLAQDHALVVVELDREYPIARRRLRNHESVSSGPYDIFVDDRLVKVLGFVRPDYGVDFITLDAAGESLWFAPLNSGELWRIDAFDLRYEDSALLDEDLAGRVEKVADTTLTDGGTIDAEGNLYLTDMEHHQIVRVSPDGEMNVLVRDPELLRWPDGMSWGPDGELYVTASALHLYLHEVVRSDRDIESGAPYHIVRFVPQDACEPWQRCRGRVGH